MATQWTEEKRAKRRAYKKAYYLKYPEKRKAESKNRWIKHKDRILNWIKKDRQKNPLTALFREARTRAKKNNLEFNILITDIIVPSICPILNIHIIVGKGKATNNSPALDRINNSKGYIKGNVQVISTLANRMKNSATKEQLLEFAKNIEKYICQSS